MADSPREPRTLQVCWFEEAKVGGGAAWRKLAELGRRDLAQWLTRHLQPKLALWEVEEISENALSTAGLRLAAIPSWPQAWAYSKAVAVSLIKDRLCRGPMHSIRPPADLADPASLSFQDRTDLLDALESVAGRFSRRQTDVLLALMRVVLEGRTSRSAAAELGMSLRSFERTKGRVVAFCTGWYASQEQGASIR